MADPLSLYKYSQAGKTYYDILPSYNTPSGYTAVTDPNEIKTGTQWYQARIDNPTSLGLADLGRQELEGLQRRLTDYNAGISTQFALNDQGVLAEPAQIEAQKAQQEAIASGQAVNVGTATAPLTVPVGTPDPKTVTYEQSLAGPAGQIPGVQPSAPVAPQPATQTLGNVQPTQTQPTSTVAYPTSALQPGATGMEVKKLQDYLVSIGLMTPEQVASGPGIYGPQTTAAVLALQQKLGVDNSSGPGFFGPKTLQALQAMGQQGAQGDNTEATDGINTQIDDLKAQQQALSKYGLADTNQLTKDAYGNYIPSQGGEQGADGTTMPTPDPSPKEVGQRFAENLEKQGTSSIKSAFDKVTKDYADLQNELNDKIAEINDNPWLTEGIRVRQIERMKEKYEGKLAILTNQQKIYDSLYQEAVATAKWLTTGEIAQQEKIMELAQQRQEADAKLELELLKLSNKGGYESGIIGEYQFAREQGYEGTFSEYQNEDANRKKSIAAASAGGLTPSQINSTVNSIAGAFDNEPIVKDFNQATSQYNLMNSLGTQSKNPGDDIAFVYAFAKLMDPNSVVREGEYATIQRYAQSFLDAKTLEAIRLAKNTNFLTADAKQKLLTTAGAKLKVLESQYNNVNSEYQRQIDDAYAGKPRQITQYNQSTSSGNDALRQQVNGYGYDYDALITDGNSDDDIKRAIENELNMSIGWQDDGPLTKAGNASASKIASAIKQVETGGDYTAKGASGESGAYQFMPDTWKRLATKHLGSSSTPMTKANQDKVALAEIQDLLNQGYNSRQIALIWNGGEPKVKKGVNSKGIAYDSGAYANKVLNALG